ncbi:hypothetical protein AGMMS50249_7520 [candidate division SR1 bacterium]|nr:hypothetical protein AGMMS50249_7520 [candidate division SR1 bacterium]
MDIQSLLAQQSQIQSQYNQIVADLKINPNQAPERIAEIKSQLDSLNATYLQIQGQLKALGYGTNQATQGTKVDKSVVIKEGAKFNFSLKKFSIGCGILAVIIVGLFAVTIFSLIRNPQALIGVGIDAITAKNLLSLFAGLVLGGLGLVAVGFLFSNIYKIISGKATAKAKTILQIILSILALGVIGAMAGFSFSNIGKINVIPNSRSNSLVLPYLVGKNGAKIYWSDVKAIAPGEVDFELNDAAIQTYIKKIGDISISSIVINCGNTQKQVITYKTADKAFDGRCFYDKKGDYTLSSSVIYSNNTTKEQNIKDDQSIGTLSFLSEIQLFVSNQNKKGVEQLSASANDKTAINLGKAPAKIRVDASSVFRDFNLSDYKLYWDMDGDDQVDRENMTSFDYIFNRPKLYYPTVKFPDLGDFVYAFPIRVEPSDVPICEVELINWEKTKYKIQINILDGSTSSISQFRYHILDTSTNKDIDTKTVSATEKDRDYTFPVEGNYLVYVDFTTVDGKKGGCESDVLQFAKSSISATYVMKQKKAGENGFVPVPSSDIQGDTVTIRSVPQILQLEITKILPDSPSVQKNVFLDGKPILNQGNTYEFSINESRNYEVVIKLDDNEKDLHNEIPIHIVIDRPDIEGKLVAEPQKGYEPLEVTFDASQIQTNLQDDEVIYFTRDFGDGQRKDNLTQGTIKHTYYYDKSKENGSFMPSVTLETRQGKSQTFSLDLPILVMKQIVQIDISAPYHPTSQAKTNDSVTFRAEFNGLPETIERDFGDGSTHTQCKGRTCYETQHTYTIPGMYTTTITLTMEDGQTADKTMNIQII